MSEPWYPSGYCERYGIQWCTPPFDGPPHYPGDITIIDVSATLLHPARADFWKAARKVAIDDWRAAGRNIVVIGDPSRAFEPGAITLALAPTPDGTAGWAAFGFLPNDETTAVPGVGWVQVDNGQFEQLFQANASGSLRAIIGHEVGHTFGFGHAPPVACMDTDTFRNTHPTAEEISALQTYWGLT